MVKGMLSGVRARGQPCDVFLADAGIAPALLQEAGARVTASQYIALFRSLTERLDDECLGFLSRPVKRGSFGLVARSALGAPDMAAAIRRVARTFRLVQDDVMLESMREGELAGLALRHANPLVPSPSFLDAMLLRVFWRLLAWLAGGRLPAARFDFAIECPPDVGSYGRIFPAPLRFGRVQSAFWIDAARLKSPVRRDEAALHTFLADGQANVILPRRDDKMVSAGVREHLQAAQAAWPDLATTAAAMHMSIPTLQRRLSAEGTSFQALKDDLRRDIAITRLNTSAVSLAALAQDLGFADSATFQRAFKSWTGSPPGAYRRSGA